ncbi:hypothetical protein [Methylomonas koyamae]|uniref:hypothetical protein n=1 Tax=Methylomonas koyamae TaxID=702114 RepID=UPI000BC359B3|nr:hypothetical protein [Methylomonas koyamae]ATG89811.1 hypothetical protein MKLM6_1565 [Methylomonas koyamae]
MSNDKKHNRPKYSLEGRRVDKRSAIHLFAFLWWMALRLSTLQLLLFEWLI